MDDILQGKMCEEEVADHKTANPISAIGIDIDGTITHDPSFFSELTRYCCKGGIPVHIVTSRSRIARRETEIELGQLGIIYDELYLLPSIDEAQRLCPHRHLDWFRRHGWLKPEYACQNELSHFIDDDFVIMALFREFAPNVSFIPVTERFHLRAMALYSLNGHRHENKSGNQQ